MSTVKINNNTLSVNTNNPYSCGIVYQSNTSTNGNPWLYNSPVVEQNLVIEYIDMMAQLLGIDINFEKFSKLTTDERKSYIRDLKIKKIL